MYNEKNPWKTVKLLKSMEIQPKTGKLVENHENLAKNWKTREIQPKSRKLAKKHGNPENHGKA